MTDGVMRNQGIQRADGCVDIYDAATENLDQAVSMWVKACVEEDKIARLGLYKACIIFAAMAVEANLVSAVKRFIERDRTGAGERRICPVCAERILKEADGRFSPYVAMKEWSKALLGDAGLDFSQGPLHQYRELVEYRNAAVHSVISKTPLLADKTNKEGAARAVQVAVNAMLCIDAAYDHHDEGWVAWWHQICAPFVKDS